MLPEVAIQKGPYFLHKHEWSFSPFALKHHHMSGNTRSRSWEIITQLLLCKNPTAVTGTITTVKKREFQGEES